jgi:diguanylate cyclase (GGDEF)-like protein
MGRSHALRTGFVLCFAAVLGIAAIVASVLLQDSVASSRQAQLDLRDARVELQKLQTAPFRALTLNGGSPAQARDLINRGVHSVNATLDDLLGSSPPAALNQLAPELDRNFATLEHIYRIGVRTLDYGPEADQLAGATVGQLAIIDVLLDDAGAVYDERASVARTRLLVGSGALIMLLLAAFSFFYVRSERVARENQRLAARNREDALHDDLTGLRNRRALVDDLEARIADADAKDPLLLAIFDLDGFKSYNDTFGHPAGDALLARIGGRFETATEGFGAAYRMGGDEFCLVAALNGNTAEEFVELGVMALSERGDAFNVGCSYGTALVPTEAHAASQALALADQRMYGRKAGRVTSGRETADVLLQVLAERNALLGDHAGNVTALADATARELDLPNAEVRRIRIAAELHDVGKSAIPDAILEKTEPLTDDEWEFMHRHTEIGERVLLAAPSLARAAPLVRSSHERVDGGGYPDGLIGDQIPLGSRIIFVCDAFDAMTSARPYRAAQTVAEALAEVGRCSGTQFDPAVVKAFLHVAELDRGRQNAESDPFVDAQMQALRPVPVTIPKPSAQSSASNGNGRRERKLPAL